jgi:5,10-methylenetetrahydromethanopterin reductase
MKYGLLTLPRSISQTREIAVEAESSGWDWLGVGDSPAVYEDSYIHQAVALAASERIQVGPAVSHVVLRHPLAVGNMLATLNALGHGRSVGTLATGNSAARGLGMRTASLEDMREAFAAIRGYWRGIGGEFRGSTIPATGIELAGCPLLMAADGPKAAELAGQIADGMFYGGSLEPEVLARRVTAGRRREEQSFWVAASVSLEVSIAAVVADMGALLVAQANRALRGTDLSERCVPASLHSEVRALWSAYDYAFHADNTRPQNTQLMSDELAGYLVERFVFWGGEHAWRRRLGELRRAGCDGVMFILGQGSQLDTLRAVTARLRAIGELPAPTALAPDLGNAKADSSIDSESVR